METLISILWRLAQSLIQKRDFLLFSFLMIGSLSSCRKDFPPTPSQGNCEQTGTIEAVPCGDGAWGNLYIRTSNGLLLKPCRVMSPGFIPLDGKKIRFSAVDPNVSDPCQGIPDSLYNCFQPAHHDMVKVITCITTVNQSSDTRCNTLATVKQIALDGCRWIFILDNGVKLEPIGVPSDFVLRDGMRIRMAYTSQSNIGSICMVGKPAKILCIEEVNGVQKSCKEILKGKAPQSNSGRFTITSVQKDANGCLTLQVGYSGCNGEGRNFQLYWDGEVVVGNATNRINLVLVDCAPEEMCDAYFTRSVSFSTKQLLALPTNGNRLVASINGYNEEVEIK
jgi:hypothetical protein